MILLIPRQGFSEFNRAGGALWGPESNQALWESLQRGLRPDIPLVLVEAHINDTASAEVAAQCMRRLIDGASPSVAAARLERA